MPTVTLDYLYLHLARDHTTFLALDLDAESVTPSKVGEVRALANGRRRAVLREGEDITFDVTLEQVTRANTETLTGWVEDGELLLLRDPRGRVVWGHAFSLDVKERNITVTTDISFTFQGITYDEEI